MTAEGTAGERRDQKHLDALTWESWKLLQLERYAAATGSEIMFSARALTPNARPPRDAYTGPYWAARVWLTGEAKAWFEDSREPRYTFADWQSLERDHRATAAEAARAAAAAYPIETLDYLRDLMGRRGQLIADARAGGSTWAEICAASGLSRMQAHTLCKSVTHPAAELEVTAADDAAALYAAELEAWHAAEAEAMASEVSF